MAVISLLTLNVTAQNKSTQEFIVGMSNDTIYGQVSISSANRKVTSVEFIREGSAVVEKLNEGQIKGFYDQVWGLYVSDGILQRLEMSDPVTKKVFLEILVLGKIDLLTYNSGGKSTFFVRREGKTPEELISFKYDKVINGKRLALKDDQYKRLLSSYMTDCRTANIENTNLNEGDLRDLLINYHTCVGSMPKYISVRSKGKWEFGASAGILHSLIKFENGTNDTYTGPQFGLYAEYFVSKRNPRLSLSGELNLRKLEVVNQYTGFYQNAMSEYHIDIDLAYLRFNTFLNYRVTNRLIILGGVSNSFVISSSSKSYIQSPIFGRVEMAEDIRKYEQGVLLGAGYLMRKVSIQARCEFSNGFSEITYGSPGSTSASKAKTSTYYLLATYRF